MKNREDIILSGVGGQGLVLAGTILAQAATKGENKNATLTTAHTVAARGGFSKADLIVSDEEIFYPEVVKADIVLCLAQLGYDRYAKNPISENSLIIYDNTMVEGVEHPNAVGFPITETAREKGNVNSANILALGILMGKMQTLSKDSVISEIKSTFGKREKILKLNLEMFQLGLDWSKEID